MKFTKEEIEIITMAVCHISFHIKEAERDSGEKIDRDLLLDLESRMLKARTKKFSPDVK